MLLDNVAQLIPDMKDCKCCSDFPKPFKDNTISKLRDIPRLLRRNMRKIFKFGIKHVKKYCIVLFNVNSSAHIWQRQIFPGKDKLKNTNKFNLYLLN